MPSRQIPFSEIVKMFAASGEFEANNIMKIRVTSIFVQDQESALKFYTEKLGFVKKRDIPLRKW